MDKVAARKLVKDTFERPFDKPRFTYFAKNLFQSLDQSRPFTYAGNTVPKAYQDYITSMERIGQYVDSDDRKTDTLIVRLKKETSLEHARTMQRNFIAWYLNGSRDYKDAALVAFLSPDEDEWRFSLVKMEYSLDDNGKPKPELTPARRWSFLVGAQENSHTAQSQFEKVLEKEEMPSLPSLEEAFNVEVVTREFFNQYRELFHDLDDALERLIAGNEAVRREFTNKRVDRISFSKKLLGQIVFLYFLQKKGWLGVPNNKNWGDGDKRFLRSLFSQGAAKKQNFFNNYLEYLFYEALARQDRGTADPAYYPRFNCKIPFLNGGLFDPINDYDWMHIDLILPNELFSNRRNENDEGTGILDIFDLYNFTVREDEPLEREVAIDPEMLGKVFENLLEVKDRKSKGTYYTPREIVHYMCQESLINYLDTALNTGNVELATEKPTNLKLFGEPAFQQQALKTSVITNRVSLADIEFLIRKGELAVQNDEHTQEHGETNTYTFKMPHGVRENAALIDEKLRTIRVCDPAIGSGAFPVGMMTEIVRARNALTTFLPKDGRNAYHFKREAIQNCLYGVDIDPGAVEIAKLRLWLSLVVDEENINQIQPLPNLDYKIICGDSLLGKQPPLLDTKITQEIEKLKPLYFGETDAKQKQEYRKQIDELIKKLTQTNPIFDFRLYFSEIYHEKDGFDVAIANPPYDVVKDDKLRELYRESVYGRANLYGLFIHRVVDDILRNEGTLAFINPKTLLADAYFANLRKYLKRNGDFVEIMKIVDRHTIFDEVLQACIIMFFRKRKPLIDHHIRIREIEQRRDISSLASSIIVHKKKVYQSDQFDGCLVCSNRAEAYSTWEKVCQVSKPMTHFGISFTTGRIQWDLYKKFLVEKPAPGTVRLIWAENIQHYAFKPSVKRAGQEYIKKQGISPGITHDTIVVQRVTADEQEHRIIATFFSPTESGFNGLSENHTNYIETISSSIHLKYLLACLNSSLYDFLFRHISSNTQVSSGQLNSLPLVAISTAKQQEFIILVDKIFAITKDEDYFENEAKQVKVKELERKIDRLVYQLYGLTPEEIGVVEGKK